MYCRFFLNFVIICHKVKKLFAAFLPPDLDRNRLELLVGSYTCSSILNEEYILFQGKNRESDGYLTYLREMNNRERNNV